MFNMNVARKGVVIRYAVDLGRGLGKFSMRRNLNRSLELPIANTRVFGTPQMVFTNPIMTIHVHKTIDRPSMNSKATRGTKVQMQKIQKEGIKNHLS